MNRKLKVLAANINLRNLSFALFGSAMIAFGTNMLAMADIPEGGILGLCLIIEHIWGVNSAISNLIFNGFLCLLAWRLMGTRYMFNAAISTAGFSLFYAVFHRFIPQLLPDKYWLLSALIGTILIEVGTGIALRYGSAPSGDHALSMALVRKGGFDFGWVNFLRDFTVILASVIYADLYTVIFALLIMTITSPITEGIVKAPKKSQLYKRMPKAEKGWHARVALGLVIVMILGVAAVYLNDINMAQDNAIAAYKVENVVEYELDKGIVVYSPENKADIKAGFVFYPGGKVEYSSYAPLLKKCAEQGVLCVIVEMPYNLAIFGINKGAKIPEQFPDITNWYIGGHSLGGTMAATCATNHDIFKGIVLLASYSTVDVTDFEVLSIYGDRDGVMNFDRFKDNNEKHLASSAQIEKISGGNHSYFAMYEDKKEDARATIDNISQIEKTANLIANFIINQE